MCAIYGIIWCDDAAKAAHPTLFSILANASCLRGRDARALHETRIQNRPATLGWNRATPTTELHFGLSQPYTEDGATYVFHNGTVANDVELGRRDGEIDSQVLPRVVIASDVVSLHKSLDRVKGSYALAIATPEEMYLAVNYKPLYYCAVESVGLVYGSLASDVQTLLDSLGVHDIAPVKMPPYSTRALLAKKSVVRAEKVSRVCVVASGGLDSTVAAAKLIREGKQVHLLHFTYGCRAETNEIHAIRSIAKRLNCTYSLLPLPSASVEGSTLTTETNKKVAAGIEGAEYAHEWVPARNFQMLALAVGWAEAHQFDAVAYGGNLEESGAYPDNEMELVRLLNAAMANVVRDGAHMRILDPVGHLMKHEIVSEGHKVDAPMDLTWSCYVRGSTHCGKCGPCFMRRTAFLRAGVFDSVHYSQPL